MKLVLATNNSHKAEELQMMLNEEGFESVDFFKLSDFPFISDPPETCETFTGNAFTKSPLDLSSLAGIWLSAADKIIVLADDLWVGCAIIKWRAWGALKTLYL